MNRGTLIVIKQVIRHCLATLGVCGVLSTAVAQDLPRVAMGKTLTTPSDGDAVEICREYLMANREAKGLGLQDLDELVVRNRVKSKHNGVTHLYLRQKFAGIEIANADYSVAVDSQGRIRAEVDQLKRKLHARAMPLLVTHLTAQHALRFAALSLGKSGNFDIEQVAPQTGPMKQTRLRAPSLSRSDIPAQLNFIEMDNGELRLAWNLVIHTTDSQDWWDLYIDASSGALLKQVNWVNRETYQIYPLPVESPDVGIRTIISGAADPVASPFGWHDTNGITGPEHFDTRGNNVFAQEDTDFDDAGGLRPSGGVGLDFSPPISAQLQPSANHEAATLNLFYWNNILHDVLYHYGFDEAAGNFQQNNYGKGGIGSDAVRADSQDGSGSNNAIFFTPPEPVFDNVVPRMQMYLWNPANTSNLEVTAPQTVAGNYPVGDAAFGAWTTGVSGAIVLALDDANAAGPTNTDGCTSFTNAAAVAGNIALVDRGECLFVEKTANAQAAGATGILIVNNAGDDIIGMGGRDPTLNIPALFLGQADGAALKAELGNDLSATMTAVEKRDSAFDNGIVAHEYAHGLTMRLTGGAANSSCLSQAQPNGMGEGWSDWLALTMTATENDRATKPRPIGAYAMSHPESGPGIRNYLYTRDMGVNPLTFADIANLNHPHGVGEVWASALWDLYWNLVHAYGFSTDLYHGSGGNNILMQLVIDGLKLQPCNPTFLHARDSIITADLINNAGANQCLIWEAFARRGMGEAALDSGAGSLFVTEAFNMPAACAAQCGNNIVDPGEQCDDGNNLGFDGCAANCRVETALQTLVGTAEGGTLNLLLDGVNINLVTSAGQSAASVANDLVDAVNNNTALQSIASTAVHQLGQIVVTGELEQFTVNDSGLIGETSVTQVPLTWPWRLILAVAISMLIIPALSMRSRHP